MKKSFTLIELLVVVAIIAILAAILLPSLNKARERARTSSCVSNLKNIGVGSRMYSDEQKDWIVPARVVEPGGSNSDDYDGRWRYWFNTLSAGYTGDYDVISEDADKNIYSCPSADAPSFGGAGAFLYSHYAINLYVSGGSWETPYYMKKTTAFKSPQSVKFVMDNHVYNDYKLVTYGDISYRHGAGDPRVGHSSDEAEPSGQSMAAAALSNCLFLDGHVEGITWGDITKKNYASDCTTAAAWNLSAYNLVKVDEKYKVTDLKGVAIPGL